MTDKEFEAWWESAIKTLDVSDEHDAYIGARAAWNATNPPAAPVQEPVAWMYEVNGAHTILDLFEPPDDAYDEGTLHPLYTTPPAAQRQWVGLTDEELRELEKQFEAERVRTSDEEYLVIYPAAYWQWQRAIEAKLKEKNAP